MNVINAAVQPRQLPKPMVGMYVFFGLMVSVLLSTLFRLPLILGLIFGAQLVLLSLAVYRKVFIVASLLVGQLTASNYMISVGGTPVSIRFIWTIIAAIMLIYLYSKEKKSFLGKWGWKVMTPAIVLVLFGTISNSINTDMSYTLQYLRTAATSLVIILMVPAVVEEEEDFKILGLVALTTCIISGFFAIMQRYNIDFLPMKLSILGTNGLLKTRAMGLNDNPVDLSFTLPLVLIPALTLLFFNVVNSRYKVWYILALVAMVVGEYVTYTRSGMYAMAAALVALPLFMRSKHKWHIFAVVLVVIMAFVMYTDMKANRYTKGVSNESSAAGRLVLWQAGAKIAMSSPIIGIGGRAFKAASAQYLNEVTYNADVVQPTDVLGLEQPHNDFLRIWVSYGTIALIAFIWLIISIFRNFIVSYHALSTNLVKGLALGCFAAFVAYSVNAFTHNVIDEVSLIWVFGGLSIALCKLAVTQKQKQLKASE